MKNIKNLLAKVDGNKTYIVAFVTILYAVVMVWTGQMDWKSAADMVLAALGVGAMRSALKKME